MDKVRLEDVSEKGSSNLAQKDIEGMTGSYPVFGASGYIGNADFYHRERDYVAVVKDGAGIGRTMFLPAKSSVIGTLQYIIPKENILPKYLYYVVKNMNLARYYTGAAIPHIYYKDYKKEFFSLPDVSEQQKIVCILEKAEQVIENAEREILKLDELIKSRFLEMFGDPVLNTMGWPLPLIEDLVLPDRNALKAGPFGSALKKEFYVESGYKIYGQEQVINEDPFFGDYYISEEKYKSLESCAVQEGDVLISLVGSYGRLLIIPKNFEPGIINPRLMKITFDKTKINPIYFKYYFQSDSLKQLLSKNTHGGTMEILNLKIVRKLPVPLPLLELQNEFEAFVYQTGRLKEAAQHSLTKLETLQNALMQQYFS